MTECIFEKLKLSTARIGPGNLINSSFITFNFHRNKGRISSENQISARQIRHLDFLFGDFKLGNPLLLDTCDLPQ